MLRLSTLNCLLAAMVLTFGIPASASAACNASPDFSSMMFRQTSKDDVERLLSGRQYYRGRLGSIDTVHWVPGATKQIVIQPDGCGSPGQITPAVAGATVTGNDVALAILARPATPGERTPMTVYATQEFCSAVGATAHGECASGRLALQGGNSADNPFKVTVPVLAPVMPAAATTTARGPVVVALVSADKTGQQELRDIADALTKTDVGDVCARTPRNPSARYACIDRIYSDFPKRCMYRLDEFACAPQEVPPNNFAEQCEDIPPSEDDVCSNRPTELLALVDYCGNLRIGFDWTGIEPSGEEARWVDGFSGISPKLVKNAAIRIPGREFLGSTRPGVSPGKPRKPLIRIEAGVPHELGLSGTVDQEASVIHILPRFAVGRACRVPQQFPDAEAAVAVVQGNEGGYETDAGPIDRPGFGWSCDDLDPPIYFACKGGDNEGMPCTRPAHCGRNGYCTGTPSCQRDGTVWEPGSGLSPDKNCKTDDECKAQHGDQLPQCGYLLFDAKEKMTNWGRIIRLKSKIVAPGRERGVCKPNRDHTCRKQADCDTEECSGYLLRTLHVDP